jgi:hypothetical protein
MRAACLSALALLVLMTVPLARAQPKQKPAPKDQPKVLLALPLGVPAGATTRITLRGLKLDAATAVRFPDSKITAKVVSKGKAAVPAKQEPNRVGNTQAQLDVTVPPGYPAGLVALVVAAPSGDSGSYRLFVDATPALAEKEPNNGFKVAQPIEVPQVVHGTIATALDVDTFRFEGKAGQRLVLEVFAARHGSALDSVLTLYDERGEKLAENDDLPDSTDSRLEVTLPRNGRYYLCIQDAHDQGGPAHVYRLVVRP